MHRGQQSMKPHLLMVLLLLGLSACHMAKPAGESSTSAPTAASPEAVTTLLHGAYDNRDQVQRSQAGATAEHPATPQFAIKIEPTAQADWSLWHMHLATDADTAIDATWAMHAQLEADKSMSLIPYNRRNASVPTAAAAFDTEQWFSLEACALRGTFAASHINASADGMPCVVIATGIGAQRVLLPVMIEHDGEKLQVHLIYLGADLSLDARRVL